MPFFDDLLKKAKDAAKQKAEEEATRVVKRQQAK